jgi:hypothetical protein
MDSPLWAGGLLALIGVARRLVVSAQLPSSRLGQSQNFAQNIRLLNVDGTLGENRHTGFAIRELACLDVSASNV